MKRIDTVYETIKELCDKQLMKGKCTGVSAYEVAKLLNLQRTNVSADLNKLCKEGKLIKIEGKPVLFRINNGFKENVNQNNLLSEEFNNLIGYDASLKGPILAAQAAILYPPRGLNTLIVGETGVGKSMFAELMYRYAKKIGRISPDGEFITFNCADYANNPQLLISQLFGVKKGAYTGADRDRDGLVAKADGGILFLDEVHRLPPEGQEMLFTLMDKGIYKALGEVDNTRKANVLIICATTENPESALLKTFIRRIPVLIKLPPLRERTLKERYELLKFFLKNEATRIGRYIIVSANALKSLLLYDCTNNVGGLKSDIQLACARAFLTSTMKGLSSVELRSADLPEYVRIALRYVNGKEAQLREMGIGENEIIFKGNETIEVTPSTNIENEPSIYDMIDNKRKELIEKGLSSEEINFLIGVDINSYFRRFIGRFDSINNDELYKIVDKQLVETVRSFLSEASKNLDRLFASKTFFGLCIHLSSTMERMKKGLPIVNYQLEEIQKSHPEEYKEALKLKDMIKQEWDIELPDDEVGYIAMFLTLEDTIDENTHVGVVVAMHGSSTASSMVDVVNKLLGVSHAKGYDMPLDQKPEEALLRLKDLIMSVNNGKGVILLYDMGSFGMMGDVIYEETGIPIRSMDMVSTPIALEATRKALFNTTLDEVFDGLKLASGYDSRIQLDVRREKSSQNSIILSVCATGLGSAVKLKNYVEDRIDLRGIEILPLGVTNKKVFVNEIKNIKDNREIIAVIGSINPGLYDIPFFSAADIFRKERLSELQYFIDSSCFKNDIYKNMEDVLEKEMVLYDVTFLIQEIKTIIITIGEVMNRKIDDDTSVGIILHIACLVERMLKDSSYHNTMKEDVKKRVIQGNEEIYEKFQGIFNPIEEHYNIKIGEDEILYLMDIILQV
ncbi:MAG: sigma 54-interacting transcriptional regulator [Thermoanaerobacteraceae bacterium]|nr:sigma 54-interacting transcriptional regulator [Thermoanaerobacteraceae bacterium]